MADENSVEGLVTQGAGKIKDATGGLTGDTGLQAEGKLDQLTGKVQRQFGDTLDEAQDQIEGFAGLRGRPAAGGTRHRHRHRLPARLPADPRTPALNWFGRKPPAWPGPPTRTSLACGAGLVVSMTP